MTPASAMSVVAIVLGVLLATSLVSSAGDAWDRAVFLALNGHRWPWPLELAWRQVSHLGLLPTNALIWSAIAWRGPRPDGAIGAAGLLVAWGACRVVKALVGRVRPHEAVESARLIGLVPSGSSFPSSHAALAVYTAGVAAYLFGWSPQRFILALLVASMVGYTRVLVGAHYPRDVIGGALIGALSAVATMVVLNRYG